MKKIGLREWVLLLTIVPTTIIGLVLGSYFTINRFTELNTILQEQGENIIEPLAIALENGLAKMDKPELRKLVSHSHNKHTPLIKSIAIFDKNKKLLVTSNYHSEFDSLTLPQDKNLPVTTFVRDTADYLILTTPVYNNLNDAEDFDSQHSSHAEILGYLSLQLNKQQVVIGQQWAMLLSILVIICIMLLTLLVTLQLLKHVTTPLSQLVYAVDRLREGKIDSHMPDKMLGEFELLRQGINAIAHAMVLQRDEMQKHIDQATSDYRETLEQYETQNIQLNIAKREAQDANRVKSDFLAKMSHELRTPLNGVIGFTRQLHKTPLNKHQKDYLDTIELSAKSLLSIISDILDFSKLEAGAMELEKIQFHLRDMVNEVMTLLAPSAHEKKLELSLYVDRDVPESVEGDPTRLKQVLINLISNAIKFTESGSVTLDIELSRSTDSQYEILFAVEDTGIGIDHNQQSSLFSAFGQADSSITRKYGGTGLGLIITKHLIEAMHGSISLQSDLGQGSRFSFNIVLTPPEHKFANTLPVKSLGKKRILYFENHGHCRKAVFELLQSWQLNISLCHDLSSLEHTLNNGYQFDIALIGHSVTPELVSDVKGLIQRIRPQTDYLYLMINTVSHNMKEALVGSGADACLSKPLNHRKLCEVIAAPYRLDHPTIAPNVQVGEKLPIKILAVDDNDANLKLIFALLQDHVQYIDTAHNGSQALSLAKGKKYDMIFMDIQMPVMDGVTACQRIQESSLNEDTPIIAVTAHALAGEKEALINHGFTGYLTKPLDEDMLREAISEYSEQAIEEAEPSQSEADVLPEPPFESHSIDWPLALQRAGGKQELAAEMLNMLLQSIPDTMRQLQQHTAEDNHEALVTAIHKFHGACCYTGVPKLKTLSETIETTLKKGASIKEIEPELFELQDALALLLHESESDTVVVE